MKNTSFIKNKKLFIIANIILILSIIASELTHYDNIYLEGFIEEILLIVVITMIYFSIEHNIIVNVFYGFAIIVASILILISFLGLLGYM